MLPAPQPSDKVGMGSPLQSDPAAPELDPAGDSATSDVKPQLLIGQAPVDDTEARRVHLEQYVAARIDAVRQEADTAHAAQVADLQAHATERLEATRRDASTALAILAAELEVQTTARIEEAVRQARDDASGAAAEAAVQHEAARGPANPRRRC